MVHVDGLLHGDFANCKSALEALQELAFACCEILLIVYCH